MRSVVDISFERMAYIRGSTTHVQGTTNSKSIEKHGYSLVNLDYVGVLTRYLTQGC